MSKIKKLDIKLRLLLAAIQQSFYFRNIVGFVIDKKIRLC